MEWAVWTASSDSEDATTQEIDEIEGAPCNKDLQGSINDAAESSCTNNACVSIDLAFVNKAAFTRNGGDSMDSVKAEPGEKPPPEDIQDLIHFGKKDRSNAPIFHGMPSTLTVNISEEDGISYSGYKDLTMQTTSDNEEQALVAGVDLGEPAEELELHISTDEFGISRQQNPRRSDIQKRKFTENAQGLLPKLAKRSEHAKKNQMPYAITGCGESASDLTCCQSSESFQVGHLMENVAAEEPINCTQSTESFSHSSELLEHQEVQNGKKTYKCPECNSTWKGRWHLQKHRMKKHGLKTPYICPKCNKSCLTAEGVSQHLKNAHNVENPYKCTDCNTTFKSPLFLKKHRIQAHNVSPKCSIVFSNTQGLRELQPTNHNTEESLQCTTDCNIKCMSSLHQNQHCSSIHNMGKPYKCTECSKKFRTEKGMDDHRQVIHKLCVYCLKCNASSPTGFVMT